MNIIPEEINLSKIKKKLKKIGFKIYFENKNYIIILKGQIYENKKKIINKIIYFYIHKSSQKIADCFNGNYVIFFFDKKKNSFFATNSKTSFYNLFYKISKKGLEIEINLKNFYKKNSYETNEYRLFEWMLLGGRCLTNQTVIKKVYYLLPGETIFINNSKTVLIKKKYLSYNNRNISIKYLYESLKNAVNLRSNLTKSHILLGLTGGLDSRILSGLSNKKKTTSYTYGNHLNFEKILASYVSRLCRLRSHLDINIDEQNYFPKNIFGDYLKIGNLNSTFQHNYQGEFFKKLTKNSKSKNIMLGCALDQFLGSTFSSGDLLKVKNINEYYLWFKKKYFLFNNKELKILFGKKLNDFYHQLKNNFFSIIKNFKYNNFVDLNDSLHFEIRILRWYNRNLSFLSNSNIEILTPTFDKNFLKLSFSTNYKLRLKDFYRSELLKKINNKLYSMPTLSNFIPTNAPEELKDIYEDALNNLENINSKSKIIKNIPSLLYDVNIARMINHSDHFKKFKSLILFKMKKNDKFKKKINFFNKLIQAKNKKTTLVDIKKVIFLLSYYNIFVILNEKENRK